LGGIHIHYTLPVQNKCTFAECPKGNSSDICYGHGTCEVSYLPFILHFLVESPRPAKSYIALHRFATASISMQVAVLPWRYVAEMDTANLLHASA